MQTILLIFSLFFLLRLLSLSYSIRNEKRLLAHGAVQYGKRNSLILTLAHLAYYFAALYEGYVQHSVFNGYSAVGLAIMLFAYAMLLYVIYRLRDVWTVKLYIVPNQRIERSLLFRTVRHPNYYLNIIPELIGVGLLCNAWLTLCIGLPLYLCPLLIRIRQEEIAMRGMWNQ